MFSWAAVGGLGSLVLVAVALGSALDRNPIFYLGAAVFFVLAIIAAGGTIIEKKARSGIGGSVEWGPGIRKISATIWLKVGDKIRGRRR